MHYQIEHSNTQTIHSQKKKKKTVGTSYMHAYCNYFVLHVQLFKFIFFPVCMINQLATVEMICFPQVYLSICLYNYFGSSMQ